ncbi:hypothetical protein [Paraburkholderia sp. GAS348]|uniref:hypothetical protein n=1 Tax=Paraburkholderia sp. GAS348 TaxID=3035132 RepID=UPI003D1F0AD9
MRLTKVLFPRLLAASFTAALLGASTGCLAKVTFFSCDLEAGSNGPARHFDYAYDDQAGTVSYDLINVGIRRHDRAHETPDSLDFSAGSIAHSINRVTLAITETYSGLPDQTNGRCSVVKAAPGAQF